MNETVRRNRRPVGLSAVSRLRCVTLPLAALFVALGLPACPQDRDLPPPAPAPSDSLGSRVDELLRAWSDLYLRAWSDSLLPTPADSLLDERSDLLGGARVVLITGGSYEGLDESFGDESLVPLSTSGKMPAETPGSSTDTLGVPSVRFADRTQACLGVLGLQARTGDGAAQDASVNLLSTIGSQRADVAAEIYAAPRRGPGRNITLRDLFLWDRADDGTTSRQNLLFLRWRPRLGQSGWRLDVGGSFDVSRSEDAQIELEPGQGGAADSTLRLTYLNYEKYGLRLELWRSGLRGSSWAIDLARKAVRRGGGGSYSSGTLSAHRTWLLDPGLFYLDLDVRRRHYDERTAALGSSWETELRARWLGAGGRRHLDTELRALATLYDDPLSIDEEDLLGFAGDQMILKSETILRSRLLGLADPGRSGGSAWEWEAGVGPVAQLIRTRGGDGDAEALGARVETELRSLKGQSNWWLDGSLELGWRKYRDQQLDHHLTFEGFTLSLAQTDYRYCQVSVMGGGDLPWSLAWEGYFSLDQEWHSSADDDARLVSFSLTLKRLWVLWGRVRQPRARPH